MELWYFLLFGLCSVGAIAEEILPIEVYAPKISGVSGIKFIDSVNDPLILVFSGNTDVASYSSNMMIIYEEGLQFSSTSDFPSDRSYYGVAYSSELDDDMKVDNAIVFGGIGPNGVLGDFWKYYSDYDFWYQLDIYLQESTYDFAYTSIYDSSQNSTRIFVVGGINNLNEYTSSANEFVIESEETIWLNDYTDCTGFGLAGAQLKYYSNKLYLFSGYFYDGNVKYFEDICSLDLSDTDNSWTKVSINADLGKYVHGGSCLYGNYIYYFFGSHYDLDGITYRDKIYKLDITDISKGWKDAGYKCPDYTDCARDSFGYACKDNEVTIIGGKTVDGATNSVFSINLSSLDSTYVLNETTFPSPRAFASLTQSSTKLLLFGGVNRGEIFDDIWEFDYDNDSKSGKWSPLTVSGSSPVPRYGHAAATQGVFTVFIGGTTLEGRILSDMWLLNLITNTWTEIVPSETSNFKIPALTRTCVMLDLPKVYFIGGQSYSGSNFDLWEYDLSTNNLERLYLSKSDVGTHGHACQLIKDGNFSFIYTFYGLKNKMNDLYCSIRKINITETDKITIKVYQDKPDEMACRGNFGFSFDGHYMVIAGGEVFPNFAMKDIWWIDFIDEYGELYINDTLSEALSGSATLAFSENVFIFSGFHDGSFSINSDLSSSLYLTSFSGSLYCGYGFYKKNDECLPCTEGTYKPTYDGKCIECPSGTTHNLQAATHISQCVPCPTGEFFDHEDTNTCVKCPEDTLCPVGSSVALNSTALKLEQQSQPKNFNQPSMGWSMTILGSIFGFSILMFTIIFCSALLFKVVFSVYDVYRAEHIIPRGETSYEEDRTKINFVGGFFTGLVMILINFNFALFIINYVYKNEDEARSLVPMISLVQEQDYSKNHLMLELYMYSFRDDCSSPPHFTSSFFNLTYAYFDEEDIGNNMTACTHVIDVDFNTLFTTGASVDIELPEYTSDMSVTLYGKSGNPGASSSYTQVITPNDDSVFKGTDPSVFSFSLMPAYYSYRGLFGQLSEYLGFRVSSFVAPEMGSLSSRENIYLATGFKIQVVFIMSESGMTTYRFHQIDPISLVILMLASVPGLIELCGFIVRFYERIYFLWKRVQVGYEGASVSEQYNRLKNQTNPKAEPEEDLGINEKERENAGE